MTKRLIGCTVACRRDLPAAQVLRDSFAHWHSETEFALLLIDEPGTDANIPGMVTPADIGIDEEEFARLAMACTADQLRAVLRPRLLARLLGYGFSVLYFEPSVRIFREFGDVLEGLSSRRPVTLFPRVLCPLSTDGSRPNAADLAYAGTFDLSVFAVCPGAETFLEAWSAQAWTSPTTAENFLDRAPAFVDHEVVRDPGVGLSVWNAADRGLAVSDDNQYIVDGRPLRSVHFAGFQPQRPWLLSSEYSDRPRVLLSEHPLLASLCAGYRNSLVSAGYTREKPHPFDTLPDGTVLPTSLRTEYRGELLSAHQVSGEAPVSPFAPAPDAVFRFLEWACGPANERQRSVGACRWIAAVWEDDSQLRRDYPDPFGADAEAFHEWCAGVGVASGRVPSKAVPRLSDQGKSPIVDQLGVAVLGKGRLAELVRVAVRASGLPSADTPSYPVVLRCDRDIPVPAGRYVIDVRMDRDFLGDGDFRRNREKTREIAETWVPSGASRDAARRAGVSRARVINLPLPDSGQVDPSAREERRVQYGFTDEFVVGTFVDHDDERNGNVLGLVNAFVAAFPEQPHARLLIDVNGAGDHPEAAERLRLATAADSRVVLVEESADARVTLEAADCVACLNRRGSGDWYALLLLEVAASGIPVVAGEHGAMRELLGSSGAKLVPCQDTGEPDLDAAAEMLKAVAEPDRFASFGKAARQDLLVRHSVAQASERLRERVEHAYRGWRAKWAQDPHGTKDPMRPLLVARHALHRTPEVSDGTRGSVTPALRKAVLKALGHYDHHIREVMRSLVEGVEETAAELLRRQYEADGRAEPDTDALRGELSQLDQRQDGLERRLVDTDDEMARARADLTAHHQRLRELENRADQAGEHENGVRALTGQINQLTSALERTLDRVDALEREAAQRKQECETAVRAASGDAAYALERTDVLQRILLRGHERATSVEDDSSPLVVCDAGLLRLPADDSQMLPWLSSHMSWDAETSALIDSLLEPEGVFLDVGSYVGYQPVRVLSRLRNSGAVVAVEPCPESRDLLRHNVEVNIPPKWASELTVLDVAAWDSASELLAEPSSAGGVTVRASGEDASRSVEPRRVIPGRPLDEVWTDLPTLEGRGLSVVHVDVGARVHRVLGGLVRLLHRDRPSIICSFTPVAIEQLGDDPVAALREFSEWGYDLVPVGRTAAVAPDELLKAIEAVGAASTVKLWLRPLGTSK